MDQSQQRSQNRYRWFILSIGVLAQASFAVAFAGIPVAGVLLRQQYGFSTEELGVLLGCMGLGVAISEIVWGVLTDRLGDKIVLMIGLFGMGSVFVVLGLYFGPQGPHGVAMLPIAALLVLAGVVGGSINSSSGRAVMIWFNDRERGLAMSIRQTAIPVGGAIGSILVPVVASFGGFASAYLMLAALLYLTVVVVYFGLPAKERVHPDSHTAATGITPLMRVDVWRVAIVGGLLTVSQFATLTFGTLYLHEDRSLSYSAAAAILIAIQVGGAFLRIYTGRYSDLHKNRRSVIRLISLVAAVSSVLLGIFAEQNIIITAALILIVGLAGHAWHGVAYTEAAVMAGVAHAGTALGMIGTTVFAAAFLTPVVIPHLLNIGGWYLVWLFVGVSSALAILLLAPGPKPAIVREKSA